MSGGSFDYAYSKFRQFADDLRDRLEMQGKNSDPRWPEDVYFTWPDDLSKMLYEFADEIDRMADIARAIEWVYSGDSAEEVVRHAFLKREALETSRDE